MSGGATTSSPGRQAFRRARAARQRSAGTCQVGLGSVQSQSTTAADVAMLIPHQANRRIITAASERLGLPEDRVLINIDRYGNTTAATIPLAAGDALEQGRLKKGDLVIFAAVGAGYTVGASLWRWAY